MVEARFGMNGLARSGYHGLTGDRRETAPRPVSEGTRGPISRKGVKWLTGSALGAPLILRVSIGGVNRLPSRDQYACLPPPII